VGIKEQQIADLALFRGCRPSDIAWIARTADTLDVGAGSTLAREGSRAREFVVVVNGVASGSNGAGPDVLLGPGAYFGEMGLLDGRPHTMTVTTLGDTRVLVFEARVFRGLLDRLPGVGRKLMEELVARVREADQDERNLSAVS
jgi:CRP/FNR family cyclic AMP-dependent transcriptional regulator